LSNWELIAERKYVAYLYGRLDAERATAAERRAAALGDPTIDRWQREVTVDALSSLVRQLSVADDGLCFGRTDDRSGARSYIGRIGLRDDDSGDPLLLDWRAPAARAFYCATAAHPEGLAKRRHFHTRGRELADYHDDVFADGGSGADSALLAALNAPRAERMRDIVATIQSEQDAAIRLDDTGVVVIEGGPGTGKTAVALHRVAYLLYTRRDRLSRSGVLLVGPNARFLGYIGQVLPSLGETDVVFATPGELVPGVRTSVEEPPRTRRIKGGPAMVDVLATAVADRQQLPAVPVPIELDDVTVDLDEAIVAPARHHARATRLPHNQARPVFREAMLEALTGAAVDRLAAQWQRQFDLPAGDAALHTADLRSELAGHPLLAAELDLLWPELTPEEFLADLYRSPERLAAAGADPALYRADAAAWTVADVPLLDEAAELLGEDDDAERKRAEQAERDRRAYAEGVLELLDTEEDPDGELLRAVDMLDPGDFADRHVERDHRDLAERAAADRRWTYGHVVVDEAQELSAMDWRALMRRCPAKSFTIVGDLAQRQSTAGARSWDEVLDPYVPGRWTYRRLTVNYRTPAEIMAVAAGVLAEVDPRLSVPESVRGGAAQPWARQVECLAEAVRAAVAEETGSVAVIVPEGLALDVPATVLTPYGAKGLEFDTVLVVEPHAILAAESSGAAQLYVALTRATQRLGILHTAPLPYCLATVQPPPK
jgi:DNA helicase IV